MKNIFSSIQKFFSNRFARQPGKKNPHAKIRCSFCGELGHVEDDCPKAAKYKLFHVDRE